VNQFSDDPQWVAEPKYNGCRLQLHILNGNVQFWDRHNKLLKYNDNPSKTIVERLKMLFPKGYYLFDGELRNNKVPGIRDMIVLWDCFIWNGEFQNHVPYALRRLLLQGFLSVNNALELALIEQYPGDFKQVFENYVLGLHGNPDEYEGLVMKNLNGKLNLSPTKNNESSWMFKIRKETGRHKF
jgi:hypothetical protein